MLKTFFEKILSREPNVTFFPFRGKFCSLLMTLLSLFHHLKSRFRRTSCSSLTKLLLYCLVFASKQIFFTTKKLLISPFVGLIINILLAFSLFLAWLVRLWEIMNSGGILIIKTNVSWDLESLRAVLGTK